MGLPREVISPGAQVVVRARPGRTPRAGALGLTVTTVGGAAFPLNIDAGIGIVPVQLAKADGLAGRWAPPIEQTQAAAAAARTFPLTPGQRRCGLGRKATLAL